jgi:hypothetical protein
MLVSFNVTKKPNVLLIVPDSKLKVTRNNTLLLVVPSSVTRKLKNLSSKVLKNSRKVN